MKADTKSPGRVLFRLFIYSFLLVAFLVVILCLIFIQGPDTPLVLEAGRTGIA